MGVRLEVLQWGLISHGEAMKRQKELVRAIVAGGPSTLVLCEHPVTLTLGRASHERNLLLPLEELERRGFCVAHVDRGGDVTLHAPGQLVVYPVVDLKAMGRDLGAYLRKLEQASVAFLRDFDIVARGDEGRRGVWVGDEKIASIGIGVSRWVTYHGVAVNIATDLSLFKVIRPCGLDVRMTSVEQLTGQGISMALAAEKFTGHCLRIFNE